MTETFSHISGILGLLVTVAALVLAWRKKLLKTGFTAFRDQYRAEMAEFKDHVMNMVGTFREMMNKNDERHTRTLERIVEIHKETSDLIRDQSNKCQLIQGSKVYQAKQEAEWKKKMEDELDEVVKDVRHIKKVLNHS